METILIVDDDRSLCHFLTKALVKKEYQVLSCHSAAEAIKVVSGRKTDYVPADMRLVESVNLKVEEASLTGESLPVEKDAALVLDQDIPLGDRKNTVL